MKKYIVAIITAVLLILMLCGWKRVSRESVWGRDNIFTYVDEETGVEYVVYRCDYGVGICPRYNTDGSLKINKE